MRFSSLAKSILGEGRERTVPLKTKNDVLGSETPDSFWGNKEAVTFFYLRSSRDVTDMFSDSYLKIAGKMISKKILSLSFPCVVLYHKKAVYCVGMNGSAKKLETDKGAVNTHESILDVIWTYLVGGGENVMETKAQFYKNAKSGEYLLEKSGREVGISGRAISTYISTWKKMPDGLAAKIADAIEKAKFMRFSDKVQVYEADSPDEDTKRAIAIKFKKRIDDAEPPYWIERNGRGKFSR